jgi:hypothetical protein
VWPPGGAPANLLDIAGTEGGFAIPQGQHPGAEWVKLVLDRPHTVMGLRIRTGIPRWVGSFDPRLTGSYHDVFRQPKTVVIGLSGANTQTLSLVDTPTESQVISLPSSPTQSIRRTFLDTYPASGTNDAVVGVGGIELLGVDAGSAGEGTSRNGPNLLRNGDFEQRFGSQGASVGWKGFGSGEGAACTLYADPWSPAVYQGLHSQLVSISTFGAPPMADRSAGVTEGVTGLESGAVYELSLAGLLRERAAHPAEDPNRYSVQWALERGSVGWSQVAAWQNLPWDTVYLSTESGTFSTYTTRLLGPGESATLCIRAWKKWATPNRELDVNLDAIALRRCEPLSTCEVCDLAHDLRPSPGQEDSNRDSYGN